MTAGDVARQRFWKDLRLNTQARIGLDRAGNALHTRDVLDLAAAHAIARDAVHVPLISIASPLTSVRSGWAYPSW